MFELRERATVTFFDLCVSVLYEHGIERGWFVDPSMMDRTKSYILDVANSMNNSVTAGVWTARHDYLLNGFRSAVRAGWFDENPTWRVTVWYLTTRLYPAMLPAASKVSTYSPLATITGDFRELMSSVNDATSQLQQIEADDTAIQAALQSQAQALSDLGAQQAKTIADLQAAVNGSAQAIPATVLADFNNLATQLQAQNQQITAVTAALTNADPGSSTAPPVSTGSTGTTAAS